ADWQLATGHWQLVTADDRITRPGSPGTHSAPAHSRHGQPEADPEGVRGARLETGADPGGDREAVRRDRVDDRSADSGDHPRAERGGAPGGVRARDGEHADRDLPRADPAPPRGGTRLLARGDLQPGRVLPD